MPLDGQLIAPSPVDTLLAKLDEPRTVAALNNLLEHADLLAILVSGLEGLVRRGEVISDSLASALGELRGTGGSSALAKLGALADPGVVDVVSTAARAISVGAEHTKSEPQKLSGVFSLMRTLKDDDVARGLSFLIHVLREFGRGFSAE